MKKYISILENMQRQATKLLNGFHHMSYSERLKRLNLPLLVYRRARGNMIEIFKYLCTSNNCILPESFRPRPHPSRNTTTNWYEKHTRMAWEDSRQFFSTSKRSKSEISSQKKLHMSSLSTHLKTNWMKHERVCQ